MRYIIVLPSLLTLAFYAAAATSSCAANKTTFGAGSAGTLQAPSRSITPSGDPAPQTTAQTGQGASVATGDVAGIHRESSKTIQTQVPAALVVYLIGAGLIIATVAVIVWRTDSASDAQRSRRLMDQIELLSRMLNDITLTLARNSHDREIKRIENGKRT